MAQSKNCRTKEELNEFINEINKSLNTDEIINYVSSNNLIFDYKLYCDNVDKILQKFDEEHRVSTNASVSVNNNNFMPITKISVGSVNDELIQKINFLITNPCINPNDFHVDVNRGIFINTRENIMYDVVKNNNGYQLVNFNQKKEVENKVDNKNDIIVDKDIVNDKNNNKVKNKKTLKEKLMPILNSGYVSTVLLTVISAISGILIAAIILVNR